MSEADQNHSQSEAAQAAFSRLEEFPSDYVELAHETVGKVRRMDEMEAWANSMGAHTERLADWHRRRGKQIIQAAGLASFSEENARRIMSEDLRTHRTGVKVQSNGDVRVSRSYPFSGDSPVEGWDTYRHPKNIK